MVLRERVKSGIEERESEEWYVTERVKSEEKREKREKRVKREGFFFQSAIAIKNNINGNGSGQVRIIIISISIIFKFSNVQNNR